MSAEPNICDLKYFAGKANELHLLRDRVAELEELLGLGVSTKDKIIDLGFTCGEATVLSLLLKGRGPYTTREFVWVAMYGSCAECDQPEDRIVDVWLVRIRRKLKRFNIEIRTIWGVGWSISESDKARFRALMEAS